MLYSRLRVLGGWILAALVVGALTLITPGCGNTCKSAADCAPGLLCLAVAGSKDGAMACQARPDGVGNEEPPPKPDTPDAGGKDDASQPDQIIPPPDQVSGDNTPGDNTPGDNAPDTPQQTGKAPQVGDLVINEVHADPKATDGDANGDGTVSSSQDEFIEFVNVTDQAIDLSGVVLSKGAAIYTFAVGTTLPARTAVVVFGGGLDGDAEINTGKPHSTKFGGALVYTKSLVLSNGGLKISLKDKDGGDLDVFGYGDQATDCPGDKDQSVTRWPDLTGPCTLHTTASKDGKLFSPGTRVGGGKFSDPAPPNPEPVQEVAPDAGSEVTPDAASETTPEMTVEAPPTEVAPDVPTGPTPQAGELVINEVLADPPGTQATDVAGDSNGDGVRDSSDDEFIEIVNVSTQTLQVGGIEVFYDTSSRFVLKPLLLPSKGVIVIFGGGMANDTEVDTGTLHSKFGAYVYRASLRLTNTSAHTVSLKTSAGVSIAQFAYGATGCEGDKKQSLTLNPDLTGTCALHSAVQTGKLFSPGTKADGTKF